MGLPFLRRLHHCQPLRHSLSALKKPMPAKGMLAGLLLALLVSQPAGAVVVDMDPLDSLITLSNGLQAQKVEVRVAKPNRPLLAKPVIGAKDTLVYVFVRPTGFAVRQGTTQYGLSIWVTDEAHHQIFSQLDARRELGPIPGNGDADITVSIPVEQVRMQLGGHYLVRVRIFDKLGDANLEARQYISVVPGSVYPPQLAPSAVAASAQGLQIMRRGLNAAVVSLTDANTNQPLIKGQVRFGQKPSLLMLGLQGFKISNGKGYPGGEMTVLNERGEEVLHLRDAMANFANGADSTTLADRLGFFIDIPPYSLRAGRYLWVTRLYDKLSDAQIGTKFWFDLR